MAARSHPPTLRSHARRRVRDDSLWTKGDTVLCACSGGPDSSALLHVLAILRGKLGHRLHACGVDHGLRAAAADELAQASALAAALNVPFTVKTCAVAPGANLQKRARDARHAALAECAKRIGATRIALGHTANDRAETLLIRLIRGSGPRGLAVMPSRAASPADRGVQLLRPIIDARRSDVMAHVERHQLSVACDPSNDDKRFLRTRVRKEVLPLLEELNPGIIGHLCALSEMMTAATGDADVPLGRAQQQALSRALRQKQPATLLLKGGYELSLGFSRPKRVRKAKA